MSRIILKNATKIFSNQTIGLDHIDLEFLSGNIYGVVGQNGSGKSLIFKAIAGLISLTSGSIQINNQKLEGNESLDIGYIIESPGFLEELSGYENLKILSDFNPNLSSQEIKKIIKLVGLDPNDTKSVRKYSMGMKQRLGIAQAIMDDHPILLLDEPFNGLDKLGVIEMRNLFLSLKKSGKLIILASHNQTDIDNLCDYVIKISAGKIIF